MTHTEILDEIKEIHPEKLMLSKKEVSKLTNRSLSALDRDIKDGTGIAYKKIRGKILYPIIEIAKWMSDLIKTI